MFGQRAIGVVVTAQFSELIHVGDISREYARIARQTRVDRVATHVNNPGIGQSETDEPDQAKVVRKLVNEPFRFGRVGTHSLDIARAQFAPLARWYLRDAFRNVLRLEI